MRHSPLMPSARGAAETLESAPPTSAAPDTAPAHREAPAVMVWTALWIVYIVWGSTYLAIRVVVDTMPPFLSASARFGAAGAIVWLFLRWRRGREAMAVSGRQVAGCALVGGLLVAGGNGLVMVSERTVPSALAALVIASVPLWVVLYRRVAGERVAWITLLGVFVGFVGIALLLLPGSGGDRGTALGLILVFCAAPCWALGSFLSKRVELPDDPFLSTAFQMMLGGGVCLLLGSITGELPDVDPARFSSDSLIAFVYLILIGSLVAFTAYVWLLQHAPISKVATYAYVNPVIAIFLGWAILSETITATMFAGAAIVVGSVAAIVRQESG